MKAVNGRQTNATHSGEIIMPNESLLSTPVSDVLLHFCSQRGLQRGDYMLVHRPNPSSEWLECKPSSALYLYANPQLTDAQLMLVKKDFFHQMTDSLTLKSDPRVLTIRDIERRIRVNLPNNRTHFVRVKTHVPLTDVLHQVCLERGLLPESYCVVHPTENFVLDVTRSLEDYNMQAITLARSGEFSSCGKSTDSPATSHASHEEPIGKSPRDGVWTQSTLKTSSTSNSSSSLLTRIFPFLKKGKVAKVKHRGIKSLSQEKKSSGMRLAQSMDALHMACNGAADLQERSLPGAKKRLAPPPPNVRKSVPDIDLLVNESQNLQIQRDYRTVCSGPQSPCVESRPIVSIPVRKRLPAPPPPSVVAPSRGPAPKPPSTEQMPATEQEETVSHKLCTDEENVTNSEPEMKHEVVCGVQVAAGDSSCGELDSGTTGNSLYDSVGSVECAPVERVFEEDDAPSEPPKCLSRPNSIVLTSHEDEEKPVKSHDLLPPETAPDSPPSVIGEHSMNSAEEMVEESSLCETKTISVNSVETVQLSSPVATVRVTGEKRIGKPDTVSYVFISSGVESKVAAPHVVVPPPVKAKPSNIFLARRDVSPNKENLHSPRNSSVSSSLVGSHPLEISSGKLQQPITLPEGLQEALAEAKLKRKARFENLQ